MGEPLLTSCLIQSLSHTHTHTFFFFFFDMIGNKTSIEKNEHHIHDDEHSGHEKIQKSQELKLTNFRKTDTHIY